MEMEKVQQVTDRPMLPVPPESLRYRVHGAVDEESFLAVGQQCSVDIQAGLTRVGRSMDSFEKVLDFGCGSGRTLRWFAEYARTTRFFGTDIDHAAVAWCHQNLPFASFIINDSLPPMAFADESFDLIYAISVFTHLNEEYQFCWLYELQRLARPGALVFITLHGEALLQHMLPDIQADFSANGIATNKTSAWQPVFPHWYQDSFHSQEYVSNTYTQYFDIVEYIPRGMNNLQDLVILRKPREARRVAPPPLPVEGQLQRAWWRISSLERDMERKNAHITRLEHLIGQIESGRVMRVLNAARRLI